MSAPVCQIQPVLLDKAGAANPSVGHGNCRCKHVWQIYYSHNCYPANWYVSAQASDPARADTAKTTTKRPGTATGHNWVQTN